MTSPDDPCHEFNLAWWDTRHVTFQVWPEEGASSAELQPYTVVVINVETGECTFEPASAPQGRSPDERHVLVGNLMTVRLTAEPYWLYDYNYIWSVRVDGVDLRPIAMVHQYDFLVLRLP